jgi:hypothetical protein
MITHVAIKWKDRLLVGNTGERHDVVFQRLLDELFGRGEYFSSSTITMGFMTDEGVFLDRKEAAMHAFSCGQVKSLNESLISEELW